MIKTLRFTLVALLALVANISFAQTNLVENGGFEAWEGSVPTNWKTTSTAGNATLAQSTDAHSGSYAVLVKTGGEKANKRIGYKEIALKAGTYNVEFYAKGGEARPGYVPVTDGAVGSYVYGEYSKLAADSWTKVDYSFTLEANTTVSLVIMNPKGKGDLTVDDYSLTTTDGGLAGGDQPSTPDVKTVDNIAAFKALADGTTAVLKLDNAVVLYKNVYTTKNGATNTEYYVRDATGAMQFFNTDLDFETGDALSGTVEGKLTIYNDMSELTKTGNTSAANITVSKAASVSPKTVEVSDLLDNTYLADLVVVKGTFSSVAGEKYTDYFLSDGDEQVQVYDKFKTGVTIPAEGEYEVKGILISAKLSGKIVYELAPLSITQASTGINGVEAAADNANAPMYNIAGQRVSKDYKGLVIVNGKKIMK